MLAAIGIIIISNISFIARVREGAEGRAAKSLSSVADPPQSGNRRHRRGGSLLILFSCPSVRNRYVRMIPAPSWSSLVAVPLGILFDLSTSIRTPSVARISLGQNFLSRSEQPGSKRSRSRIFAALTTLAPEKWVVLFALIGALSRLLSAKAIDLIDPWKRKNEHESRLVGRRPQKHRFGLHWRSPDDLRNRSQQAERGQRWPGPGSLTSFTASSCSGSWRWCQPLIHRIPSPRLCAMLVYTGFRLASPRLSHQCDSDWQRAVDHLPATMVGVRATTSSSRGHCISRENDHST